MLSFPAWMQRGLYCLSVLSLLGMLVVSPAHADVPPKLLKQLMANTQVIAHVKVSKLAFVVAPESDGTWGECLVEGGLIKFKRNKLKLKKYHWAKLSLPCLRTLDAGKKRKKGMSLPPKGPMAWRNVNTVGIGLVMEVYLNKTKQAGSYVAVLGKANVVGGKKVDRTIKVYEPKAPKPKPRKKPKGEVPPPQKPFSKKELAKMAAKAKANFSSAKSSKKPTPRKPSVRKKAPQKGEKKPAKKAAKKAAKKDDDEKDDDDENDEDDEEELEDIEN